jgi:hypothetical protein
VFLFKEVLLEEPNLDADIVYFTSLENLVFPYSFAKVLFQDVPLCFGNFDFLREDFGPTPAPNMINKNRLNQILHSAG